MRAYVGSYDFSTVPTAMSLPAPFEFPLPRAVHYTGGQPRTTPAYTIHIVESWVRDGVSHDIPHCIGVFAPDLLFHELQELYGEYNIHGGFIFPTDSIAMRMKSMDRVLCWFGFRENHKYTCFIEGVSTPIS